MRCGKFAALLEDDTERNREDARDQEFPARRRRHLRITGQEDAEVHDSCINSSVRGAEALMNWSNTGWGFRSGCDPAPEVVAIEC